jgi:hypothetical protein
MIPRTTTENINGELMTVVWHSPTIKSVIGRRFVRLESGVKEFFAGADCLHHIATALPALSRNPKPEDAAEMEALTRLFSEYRAKGLMPQASINTIGRDGGFFMRISPFRMLNETCDAEITHAINTKTGERVEIAIKEKTNDS